MLGACRELGAPSGVRMWARSREGAGGMKRSKRIRDGFGGMSSAWL